MSEEMIKKYKLDIDSLLLVIYIFSVPLAMPLEKITQIPYVSVIIAITCVVKSIKIHKSIDIKLNLILILIFLILILDLAIFDYKTYTINVILLFIRWGMIPLYLSSKVVNYRSLLRYWYKFGIANLVIWNLFNIITNYSKVEDYMTMGVYLTYSFIAFSVDYYSSENEKRISLILLLTTLIEIIVFTNRGSIITCFISLIYLELIRNTNKFSIIKNIVKLLIIFLCIIKINDILSIFENTLLKLNISSYSFNKLIQIKDVGLIGTSSGRDSLFIIAKNLILDTNLKANGLGFFDYTTGLGYPHNIILDITISFGIIGLIVFVSILIFLLIKYYKYNRKINNYNKIIVSMSIFCVIRLSLSSTLWSEPLFWSTIGLILFNHNYININREGE